MTFTVPEDDWYAVATVVVVTAAVEVVYTVVVWYPALGEITTDCQYTSNESLSAHSTYLGQFLVFLDMQ